MSDLARIQATMRTLRAELKVLASKPNYRLLRASDLMVLKQPPGLSHQLKRRLYKELVRLGIVIPAAWRYGWQSRLKHGLEISSSPSGSATLLVWARDCERDQIRSYCEVIQQRCQDEGRWIPVLVTDVADFAWFSRLGWLVEYLPSLGDDQRDYVERKIRHLAWLYEGAIVIPLAAASLNEVDWKQLLDFQT